MKEVSIKSHTRRGKNGTTISVKGYTRRVGRKGVHSPKRPKQKNAAEPGEELKQKIESKAQYTGPKMSAEEFKAWNDAAREATMKFYGKRKPKPVETKKDSAAKKVKGHLENLEDKIARFVDKYSKKAYKRAL